MNKIIIIIFYLKIIWGLNFTPYLNSYYYSDSDLYPYDSIDLFNIAAGTNINIESDNVKLTSDISYNFYDGLNELPNKFNPKQGFVNIENNEGLSSTQFNYFLTSMKINYNNDKLNIYMALDNPLWGLGNNKIILSDKAPPFFNIGYNWKLAKNITYEHLYGKLNSLIQDSLYSEYYADETSRDYYVPRIISAHKIDFILSKYTTFGFFEIIVYGGNRSFEPYYVLPLVPFLPIQTYLGDIDNDLLGLYLDLNPNKNLNLYLTLVIDEWTPPYTFNKEHKNWFVYQIGFSKKNFLFKDSKLNFEYIWSDNRVYNHKASINDFYSNDYPLGFWAGPHAEQLYIAYLLTVNKFEFQFEFSNSKRGESVSGYYDNFIERYSSIVEIKKSINFTSIYKYNKNIEFIFGVDFINWKNAGFNPFDSIESTSNIAKENFQIGVNYRFKEYRL